jgi:hypothetical protein
LCAAVAGALNARAVIGIVDGVAAHHLTLTRPRSAASVSLAVAGVFVVAVVGTLAGFSAAASAARTHRVAAPIPHAARGRPVIVAAGFGSHWNPTSPLSLPSGYVGWRYSYKGLDRRGRLRPYGPRDTIQPLGVSARQLAAEVDALFRAYGKPVSIVAESEGALVARTYLLHDYSPASHEVERLITLDMPRVQGSVYFPPDGGQGWGVASGWGLRGLASVVGRMSRLPFSTQAPLMKEVLRCRSSINSVGSSALPPGIQEARVVALADAVAGDPGTPQSISKYVVTAAHGGLIHKTSVISIIAGILDGTGHQASARALALVRILGDISAPWSTPSLAAGWGPAKIC